MAHGNDREGRIPRHIGIIMDGNGRWAQRRGLPRLAGHRAGVENIRRVVEACVQLGVEYLTLYAFSTENWRRPREEVQGLMNLLRENLRREVEAFRRNGIRVLHLGRLEGLDPDLQEEIRKALEATAEGDRLTLCIAFNYGGRAEIVDAVRRIVAEGIPPEAIDEETIRGHLYAPEVPDPDLIIRTAGEMRLSNFLLWEAAYSEFWSTPTLWPDFGREELEAAITDYGRRVRKFGGVLEG